MSNIKENISVLKKQRDDKKYERKLLATDYENHKEAVKKSGITALITVLVYYVILLPLTHYTKSVTLMGLGRFLIPFALLVFLVSFIYFLIKGFDFFVNADNKYSKMMAEKFKVNSVSDELRLMNEAITMMDVEIARLENELYESGEDFNFQEDDSKETTLFEKPVLSNTEDLMQEELLQEDVPQESVLQENVSHEDMLQENVSQNNMFLKAPVEEKSTSVKRYRINLVSEEVNESNITDETNMTEDKNRDNSIDDIFNGLDEYLLEEDEDFESSSDMWEKDAMRRFSKL